MEIKDLENSVETIKRDFQSLIPQNVLEILTNYALSIVVAILIFFVGMWFSKKFVKVLGKSLRKVEIIDETLVRFIENIVYYSLLVVVILAVLNNLGIKTTSFLAILGAAGIAIGLALKDSLGNFASGVMIVLFKPFKVGDSVNAGGVSGIVTEVTIFSTVFQTSDNRRIIVPNSSITKASIINLTANPIRRVDIVVSISYEDSINKAKDVLRDIISKNDKVLKDKDVSIAVSDLADSSVNITINVWVDTANYSKARSELLESIKTTFDELGITIPYPTQYVYQYNKN
ncbi:mechanosensitive ion channel family protein [Aliarcobacter skirrowii]|uniref:mechanosensitive ion channel family protein n=1 Tax=Aliarcobacter skirrowii TaxID=28200 RepID=UPI0008251A88|nr:mechanosensitive ion channel domain-containing protein [Aliarcobacter skirrowii]MDD2507835.1 mechanosensitive ion channel [Aliarcobacter skirrowii]MDD3496477.1 mechanosensitive ion channel [Aliarcobacter skirrowii]